MSIFSKSAVLAASVAVLYAGGADPKLKPMETFKTSVGIHTGCTAKLAQNPSWDNFSEFEGCLYALTNKKHDKSNGDHRISENNNFFSNIGAWVKFLGEYVAPNAAKKVDPSKFIMTTPSMNGTGAAWKKVEDKAKDFPRWSFDAEKMGKGSAKDRVVQVVRCMYETTLKGRSWKTKDGDFANFDMVEPLNAILCEAQPDAVKTHEAHKAKHAEASKSDEGKRS